MQSLIIKIDYLPALSLSSCNKSGVCTPVACRRRCPKCRAKMRPSVSPQISCQSCRDTLSNSFPVDGSIVAIGFDFMENVRLHHEIHEDIWFEFHSDGSERRIQNHRNTHVLSDCDYNKIDNQKEIIKRRMSRHAGCKCDKPCMV